MALQPRIIACGNSTAAFAMAVRFLTGPAVMAAASIAVGLRGVLLHVAIVQVTHRLLPSSSSFLSFSFVSFLSAPDRPENPTFRHSGTLKMPFLSRKMIIIIAQVNLCRWVTCSPLRPTSEGEPIHRWVCPYIIFFFSYLQ